MKALSLAVIAAVSLSLSACSAVQSLLKDPKQIETVLAAEAAGEYKVEFSKDGQILHTETWDCTKGEDGKLSGCHRK